MLRDLRHNKIVPFVTWEPLNWFRHVIVLCS